jgi:CubicO group peptidase (beta-lactamase class C family)
MKNKLEQSSVDQIVQATIKKKNIFGAVFYVSSEDNNIDLMSASGNIAPENPYYIASINKMFISSILLKLFAAGRLDINNKISEYILKELMTGLHIYKGKEYSDDLTITHLLSHTSGLPDYLTDKQADGRRVMAELEAGIDQPWPVDKIIKAVKN